MNEEETKFYSIGRGNLNIDGKFYYGLDYTITDFMRSLEQERNNYKELYEKENKNWNELKELLKTELRDVYDKEHPLALDSSYIKYTTERKMNLMWVYEKMQEIERL